MLLPLRLHLARILHHWGPRALMHGESEWAWRPAAGTYMPWHCPAACDDSRKIRRACLVRHGVYGAERVQNFVQLAGCVRALTFEYERDRPHQRPARLLVQDSRRAPAPGPQARLR